ncbi:hypothetical protein BJ944DRAFT_246321 [Cunninghamella echinulata]|nr:hypothetical protein BJ944DRAFT_246321 [Cunninghamella echinulata]
MKDDQPDFKENDDPLSVDNIVYICSPNQLKKKKLEAILQNFEPSSKIKYYTNNEDSSKLASLGNSVVAIGSIQFPTSTEAEFIYALLNGTSIDNEDIIQLRYNKFNTNQIKSLPPSLIVSKVPKQVSIQTIYTLFRKIGPIVQCILIKDQQEDSTDTNRINIQYISKSHTSEALSAFHNTTIENSIISVSYGVSPIKNTNSRSTDHSNENTLATKKKSPKIINKEHYKVEIKPSMDLCNLYIKGLPMTITSTELFNLFKPYGRIISARVMENEKGKSKGFGFVSYSQSIESAAALISLHRYYDIQFHEPKTPRPDQDIVQQYWSLLNSTFHDYFYSTTLPPLPPSSTSSLPMTIPPTFSPHSISQYYPVYPYSYHYYSSSPPSSSSATTTPYQLSTSLPSNYHYNLHPHYYYAPPPPSFPSPPLYPTTYYTHPSILSSDNNGSYNNNNNSNADTNADADADEDENSSNKNENENENIESQLKNAIQKALVNEKEQQEIVDYLMTLDLHKQQLCIEQPDYLLQQLTDLKDKK